jgi:3-dehydroquinate synthase
MIHFQHIQSYLKTFFQENSYSRTFVLVDENTKKYTYPVIKNVLPDKHFLIQIKSGEEYKNIETCSQIWQQLTRRQADRQALLINLGGGVIGDMGGFCAATYKRGMAFVQIPTTLLAQTDAATGGKLGVDFQGLKNQIGVFRQPEAIFVDTAFLQTLPLQEMRSGFAEVIKHCLIADAAMWQKISRLDLEQQNWNELVPHSIAIKENITRQDPEEKGLRKVLNFGHTLGHAIESFCLSQPKRKVLHGEAIAAGMLCETWLSVRKTGLSESHLHQMEEFIFSCFGRIKIKSEEINEIARLTLQDKKNTNGIVQCVLLEEMGKPLINQAITLREIKSALKFYLG